MIFSEVRAKCLNPTCNSKIFHQIYYCNDVDNATFAMCSKCPMITIQEKVSKTIFVYGEQQFIPLKNYILYWEYKKPKEIIVVKTDDVNKDEKWISNPTDFKKIMKKYNVMDNFL